jgi:hypothetical protein
MLALLVMLIGFVSLIAKLTEAIEVLGNEVIPATDEIRALICRGERYKAEMRLARLTALVLAAWSAGFFLKKARF